MSVDLNLVESLKTSFVDKSNISLLEDQPKLLINDSQNGKKVLTNLIEELKKCDEFFLSVAFVTNSGAAILINTLKEFQNIFNNATNVNLEWIEQYEKNYNKEREMLNKNEENIININPISPNKM